MQLINFAKYKNKKFDDVSLAKKGDKEAFVTLIRENKVSLYRIARGILKTDEDIEDAIQSSIVKAYENIHSLRKDKYFKTWLIRILINECNIILRHHKKNICLENSDLDKDCYIDKYCNIDLWNGINSLKEELRLVTILFYFEDMPQKDISSILKIPEGTVRSRLNTARKILSKIIDN